MLAELEGHDQLNLGCGRKHLTGAINLDIHAETHPDVTHDLNRVPWPFPDGICKECMPEWFKDPVNMERMEAVQRVMRARFRKQMEELGQKARAAALKVLDIADEIAGRF